ncbi:hypothetical protein CHGG_10920 [Chaetomium globosum CBS 148.51]|uniref:SET domain-containing protein n=1 Tax=Chaetomium globosum (strain ATCC 6205 / CBS 148.51 / DSM 1962 / NBRC 6347 / NRRL 1970) TaxID=306901 RepID=Q2GM84_CHAGB|nr:uncharacterized protein CHGG_10920 [Chaetomium globosum CBS 148.51]EAQ83102.1 hypothetical protein CHGG_10920 [Chaetomium globosum CBS 148.51]
MASGPKHQRALGIVTLLPCLFQVVLGHGSLHEYGSVPLTLRPVAVDVTCPLPVDDNAVQSSPWTHPPECEHTTDGTVKYCAYTNSNHGPRGWSIITTPETAANSASFLTQQLNVSSSRDAPYKMVDIPGKGKGIVATRPIKQYEEILVEHAAMLVDIAFTVKVQATRGYRLLHAAVDRLSDPVSVLELGKSNGLAQDEVENILRTNAFNTPMEGVPHLALYPTVSRINHGCNPNANTRPMPETLQISIIASRDIAAGEEITHSYLPLGLTSTERALKLHRQWNFTCTCPLCASPPATLAASDTLRRSVSRLRKEAIAAFQAGKPYAALRLTRQVAGLLEEAPEGELRPLLGEQYENMARVWFVLRDRGEAERWGRRALEVLDGPGGAGERELEGLWRRFEEEEGGRY